MVRVWGLVKGYTPLKVNIAEGRRLKINISTDLLSPAGKEIVGILHLNGTKIFLQKDQRIAIGSSKICAIRIKDKRIEDTHLIIRGAKDGIELEPMSINGNIAVVCEKTKQVTTLSLNDLTTLPEGGRIFFELSGISPDGKKRLLEMKLENPRTEFTLAVREIARVLLDAPCPVEPASPEQALAGVEDQPSQKVSYPIDEDIVWGTRFFQEAKTIDEVLNIYTRLVSISDQKRSKFNRIHDFSLGAAGGSLVLAVALSIAFSATFTAVCLGGLSFACMLFAMNFFRLTVKEAKIKSVVESEMKNVLMKLDPKKLAEALTKRSGSDRKKILALLNRKQSRAVRDELKNLLRPQATTETSPRPLLPEAVPLETVAEAIPAEPEREKVPVGRS